MRQNNGIRQSLSPPAVFWAVQGLAAASWGVLGGFPGISSGILGLPLGSTVASWGLLRDSVGLLRVFLRPPAAFYSLLGFLLLSAASIGFLSFLRVSGAGAGVRGGFLRLSAASCGCVGPAWVPFPSAGVHWGLLRVAGLLCFSWPARVPAASTASLGRRPGLAVWLVERTRLLHFFGTLQSVRQSVVQQYYSC